MSPRYGMTVPFSGLALADHRDAFRSLVDAGYTDVWTAEADGADGFTPLCLAAAWAPELRLGVAIIPAFTRGPALMAQSAASLAARPGWDALSAVREGKVVELDEDVASRWGPRIVDFVTAVAEAVGGAS